MIFHNSCAPLFVVIVGYNSLNGKSILKVKWLDRNTDTSRLYYKSDYTDKVYFWKRHKYLILFWYFIILIIHPNVLLAVSRNKPEEIQSQVGTWLNYLWICQVEMRCFFFLYAIKKVPIWYKNWIKMKTWTVIGKLCVNNHPKESL